MTGRPLLVIPDDYNDVYGAAPQPAPVRDRCNLHKGPNLSGVDPDTGQVVRLFDPRDDGSVTAALQRVLADKALRERLVAAGLARAAEFTWERAAEATLASYERALSRRA